MPPQIHPHLSRRLARLYEHIRPGLALWDIGCDHGRLGLRAAAEGRADPVVLVDRSPAVVDQLRQRMAAPHRMSSGRSRVVVLLADAARLQLGDHASEGVPGELAGTVVLAGLGARSIVGVLEGLVFPDLHDPNLRVLMQPEVEVDLLRQVVQLKERWGLREEEVVERGRTHTLFIADRGAS